MKSNNLCECTLFRLFRFVFVSLRTFSVTDTELILFRSLLFVYLYLSSTHEGIFYIPLFTDDHETRGNPIVHFCVSGSCEFIILGIK